MLLLVGLLVLVGNDMIEKDFIEIFRGAMHPKDCQAIIDYTDSKELVEGKFLSRKGRLLDKKEKDCWQVPNTFFNKGSDETSRFISMMIVETLKACALNYRTIHSESANIIPWLPSDGYNIQKYFPGQAYHGLHCENVGNAGNNRCLVWMIYLNTVTDGGGTYFSNYDKTLDAVQGDVVIWPAYWTHMHKGIPSPTETKYIATGWFEHKEEAEIVGEKLVIKPSSEVKSSRSLY